MPYINKPARKFYDDTADELIDKFTRTGWCAGDVNYVFSKILWAWFKRRTGYAAINEIMGVLSCIAAEFYRRQAAPYEDTKINKNGDVS